MRPPAWVFLEGVPPPPPPTRSRACSARAMARGAAGFAAAPMAASAPTKKGGRPPRASGGGKAATKPAALLEAQSNAKLAKETQQALRDGKDTTSLNKVVPTLLGCVSSHAAPRSAARAPTKTRSEWRAHVAGLRDLCAPWALTHPPAPHAPAGSSEGPPDARPRAAGRRRRCVLGAARAACWRLQLLWCGTDACLRAPPPPAVQDDVLRRAVQIYSGKNWKKIGASPGAAPPGARCQKGLTLGGPFMPSFFFVFFASLLRRFVWAR